MTRKRKVNPPTLRLSGQRSLARLAGAMALAALSYDERRDIESRARVVLENLFAGGSVK